MDRRPVRFRRCLPFPEVLQRGAPEPPRLGIWGIRCFHPKSAVCVFQSQGVFTDGQKPPRRLRLGGHERWQGRRYGDVPVSRYCGQAVASQGREPGFSLSQPFLRIERLRVPVRIALSRRKRAFPADDREFVVPVRFLNAGRHPEQVIDLQVVHLDIRSQVYSAFELRQRLIGAAQLSELDRVSRNRARSQCLDVPVVQEPGGGHGDRHSDAQRQISRPRPPGPSRFPSLPSPGRCVGSPRFVRGLTARDLDDRDEQSHERPEWKQVSHARHTGHLLQPAS